MRRHLRSAAEAAGITEAQAEAFVRAVLDPTGLQCEAGGNAVVWGSMFTSPHLPPELHGLSSNEFDHTVAAMIWRRMAAVLLARDDFPYAHPPDWPIKRWPHPSSEIDFDWGPLIREAGREDACG